MANLSKVQINGVTYDLKDAEVRQSLIDEVKKLKAGAYSEVAADINGAGLIDAATVKSYVDAQVGAISQFSYEVVEALPAASADTMYKIYLVADADGKGSDVYEEWITIEKDGAYSFEKIGDTNLGLDGYVPTSRTIAGLALSKDITAAELQGALGLKALAYKDSAQGTIDVVTGINAVEHTPEGTVTVTLAQAATDIASAGKFTPAGNVTGTVKTAGSIAVTAKHAATAATLTKGDYTPAGSVTADFSHASADAVLTKGDYTPAGNVSVALSGASFNAITSVGTAASFTEGEFTPASLTYGESDSFAKAGLVGEVEDEMLVLTAASTGKASVISAFSGGSKAADTFVANTPASMAAHEVGVQSAAFTGTKAEGALVTGVSYDKASLANLTFAGTKAEGALVTGVSYDKADIDTATFTGETVDIAAQFAGTEGDVAVAGKYDKASVESAVFAGTKATINHTLTQETKTITVQ